MRMQSKRPIKEESTDRGVSPVIGVILMVAITVILAAVIAAFVLDIGPGDSTPNAQLDIEYDDDDGELDIIHNGGDGLDPEEISVNVQGEGADPLTDSDFDDGTFSTGDVATFGDVDHDGIPSSGTHTVQIIHEPSDGTVVSSDVNFGDD